MFLLEQIVSWCDKEDLKGNILLEIPIFSYFPQLSLF